MRVLVLIATDNTVRNFVETGAFDALDPQETFYVSSRGGVSHEGPSARLAEIPTYLGAVEDPRPEARRPYRFLRHVLLAATRGRSRTMNHKLSMLPWRQRLKFKTAALPGIRQYLLRRTLKRTGLSEDLQRTMREVEPDLVLAPSNGYDPIVWDGMRSARSLGIPSVALIANWDNLSSKGIFPALPDYLGVWGPQGVEHAEQIHGMSPSRVEPLGAPQFDHYFAHERWSTEPPFDVRYAVFAGCFAPFDELTALRRLEHVIEAENIDLTIVYRPHPHRFPRKVPDIFDEDQFRHVVLDPQVRDLYRASAEEFENWNSPARKRSKPLLPALDYYPRLFEHAEFVICPLSTMIVEAALFGRRVAVIAYDDGIHENSPAAVLDYEHFEGVDRVDGFEVCRSPEDMEAAVRGMARQESAHDETLPEQMRYWLHFDDRPYRQRLRAWLEEIAALEGISRAASDRVADQASAISQIGDLHRSAASGQGR